MENKLSLSDLDVTGKKILMRVDFNVPLDHGEITDDTRIKAALPSIQYVLKNEGSLILMSHLGRPKGKPNVEFSLSPCAVRLSNLLKQPVQMASDCVGPEVESQIAQLKPGNVILLENLRFHPGEEKPAEEPGFVEKLAKLGDIYVNDAFGTAHRAHASTTLIASLFPGKAAAGFLMEKELQFLGSALLKPKRPFYAIIGGAKISTKIGVLKALTTKVDALLLGGGMAYTFFKAMGVSIGNSICEDDQLVVAKELLDFCKKKNVEFLLPLDLVVADKPVNGAKKMIVEASQGIPEGYEGVDIGPKTIELFKARLKDAATIFWNGPLGIFEQSDFALGTQAIAEAVASSQGVTVVGGGDSIAALEEAGVADKITHISTGGGATLEFIENRQLPGIKVLTNVKK
jgi:phosphoglycerate kinase